MPLLSTKKRFGMVAVQKGFITMDQLIEAIGVQAREDIEGEGHRLIGEILLEKGYISAPQIYEVIEERFEPRFGDVAVKAGYLTLEQLIESMNVQVREEIEKGRHRLLGEIVIDRGFMNARDVQKVLKEMKQKR
ncbi:MAG: hypothetical protein JXL84_14540 [Deltaproteobacteria bacterium]|nr:hypothetical protein [Deltaproteobacteria bacterium]